MNKTVNLDEYDKKIVTSMLEDSTISNVELASKIGLAASSCLMRVKKLNNEKIITGYTAIVDEKKLGYDVTCFATVFMSPLNGETAAKFIEEVKHMPEVIECYTITGNGSFLVKIIAKSFQEYRDFVFNKLLTIPNVSNIDSSIVVGVEKKTTQIPLD